MSVNITERFQQTSLGEKIILIAAPLLLIDSFLPWYDVDLGPFGSITRSGWESPGALWSMLAVLIGIVMFAQIALSRFTTVQMPALPEGASWGKVHLGLGVAAAVLVLIKLVNESSALGFGFYLGIVLVAALAAGGFLMFQAESKGGSSAM